MTSLRASCLVFLRLAVLLLAVSAPAGAQPPTAPLAAKTAPASPSAATAAGDLRLTVTAPPAAAPQGTAAFKGWTDAITGGVAVFWSALGLLAGGFAGWLVWREWRRDPIVVEPFDVPAGLAETGLTGAVLSQQLFDEIVSLQTLARTDDGPGDAAFIELPRLQVDLQLPGMSWSVRGAIRYFRQALGRGERRLMGEVVQHGRLYTIRLRGSQGRAVDVPVRFRHAGDFPAALRAAAEAGLQIADPFQAATLFHALDTPADGFARTLAALRLHLADGGLHRHQDAYVLWAAVCRALGDPVGMEERLALAREAGRPRHRPAGPPRLGSRYLNFTGSLARERRDLDAAETAFDLALAHDRRNIGALNNLGLVALDRHQSGLATQRFRQLLRRHPRSSRGHRGLGLVAERDGDLATALVCQARAVDLAPRARWPRLNHAELLKRCGLLAAATAEAEALVELAPDFGPGWRLLARLALDQGRLTEATELAARAIAVDPADPWVRMDLARARLRLGQTDAAEAVWREVSALRPNLPALWRLGAEIAARRGDVDGVEARYQRAIDCDPADPWAWIDRGWQRQRRGDPQGALAALAAMPRADERWELLRAQARLLNDAGDWRAAGPPLRRALDLAPEAAQLRLDLAWQCHRRGDPAGALAEAGVLLAQGVLIPEVARLLRNVHLRRDDAAGAEAALRDLARRFPAVGEVALELAALLREQERHAEALALLGPWCADAIAGPAARAERARVQEALGDTEAALADLQAAARDRPDNVDLLVVIADRLLALDRPDLALPLAERVQARRDDWAEAGRCLADVLIRLGRHDEAERLLVAALAAEPGREGAVRACCRRLREWGRADAALACAEEFAARFPLHPTGAVERVRALEALGRIVEAEAVARAAAAAAPPGDDWVGEVHGELLLRHGAPGCALAAAAARSGSPMSCRSTALRIEARWLREQGELDAALDRLARATEAAPEAIDDFLLAADWLAQQARDEAKAAATGTASAAGPATSTVGGPRAAAPDIGTTIDFRAALDQLTAGLARRPHSLKLLRRQARLLCEAGDFAVARATLDTLAELAPKLIDDALDWADAMRCCGDGAAAEAMLAELARRAGKAPVLLLALARAELAAGRADGVEAFAAAADAQAPMTPRITLQAAGLIAQAGRPDAAIALLGAAVQRQPDEARLHHELARQLARVGRAAQAEAELDAAAQCLPRFDIWRVCDHAEVCLQLGRRDEALAAARQARALSLATGTRVARLGRILAKAGDPVAGSGYELDFELARLDAALPDALAGLDA
ncbi:tetratricopeptide repeat protein [Derxia gummosa]|uniref:Tetratricopeptide repeat protein n=1 Tax=Derxia gummosa DSM 723 TaxID=1121388 RepID=A0A8B6X8K3_9BURK|nr:tetratricopeptide repeat protein [Derxia gummosa]